MNTEINDSVMWNGCQSHLFHWVYAWHTMAQSWSQWVAGEKSETSSKPETDRDFSQEVADQTRDETPGNIGLNQA